MGFTTFEVVDQWTLGSVNLKVSYLSFTLRCPFYLRAAQFQPPRHGQLYHSIHIITYHSYCNIYKGHVLL